MKMAEEQGHRVLFTPPYHSDLQPIELVWALVKGNVGCQYNAQTTLSLVYERLMAEFAKLEESGHHSIGKMVDKCAAVAQTMYDEAKNADDAEDYDSTDELDGLEDVESDVEQEEVVENEEETGETAAV